MWEVLTFAREQPYESSSDEKVIANLSSLYSAGNPVMVSLKHYLLPMLNSTLKDQKIYLVIFYLRVSINNFRCFLHLSNAQEKFETSCSSVGNGMKMNARLSEKYIYSCKEKI